MPTIINDYYLDWLRVIADSVKKDIDKYNTRPKAIRRSIAARSETTDSESNSVEKNLEKNHWWYTKSYRSRYPLHSALIDNNYEVKILKKIPVTSLFVRDTLYRTPLYYAIDSTKDPSRRLELCKLLLEHGADIKTVNVLGANCLDCFLASENVDEENEHDQMLLDLFISSRRCADRNELKQRALEKAVGSRKFKFARKLLDAGVIFPCQGEDLLTLSVKNKDIEMFKFLLNCNADVNNAHTVYYAIVHNQLEALNLLFSYGAELAKMDFTFLYAFRYSNTESMNILIHRMFQHGSESGALECLLDNGFVVNQYEYDNCPCLLSEIFESYENLKRKIFENFKHEPHFSKCVRLLDKVLKLIVIEAEIGSAPIKESTLQLIANEDVISRKFRRYEKQVKAMKATRILNSSRITYFDLVSRKGKSLILFCDRKIVAETLRNKNLFPDFKGELERNLRRGSFQRNIYDNFKEVLYCILKKKLTFDLICSICNFLEIKDLMVFALSCVDICDDVNNLLIH